MLKKGIILLLVITFVGFSSIWLTAQEKPLIIKSGHSMAPIHPMHLALTRISETVARNTNNRIQIQVFPSAQLGSPKDMIQATMIGTQGIAFDGGGILSPFLPRLSIVECPYIWRDYNHFNKVMKGPIGQELASELLAKRGIRTIGVAYYGVRHVTTTNRPVYKPEDLNGVKLRVPEIKLCIEYGKALGANPTPMAFAELYFGLKTGVVEGQENPLPTIEAAKFYEVQKYLILTGHVINALFLLLNEKLWQSLSPDDQRILQEAVTEGLTWHDNLVLEKERMLIDKFKQSGMIVIGPKEGLDIEAFRKASLVVPKLFEDVWGKGLYERIVSAAAN